MMSMQKSFEAWLAEASKKYGVLTSKAFKHTPILDSQVVEVAKAAFYAGAQAVLKDAVDNALALNEDDDIPAPLPGTEW